MKKKLLCGLLAVAMTLTTVGVMAADFTDGIQVYEAAEAVEATEDVGSVDDTNVAETEDTDPSEVFDDGAQLFSEEVPELTDSDAPSARSLDTTPGDYQVSITGKLYLSETEEFVRLINVERKKLGLNELKIDQEMMDIACRRAVEANVYYDHTSPNGIKDHGNAYGEVLSPGYSPSAKEHMEAWKGTALWEKPISHWDILMKPEFDKIGFAVFGQEKPFTGLDNSYYFAVADLGFSDRPQFYPYNNDYKDKVITRTIDVSSNCASFLHGETKTTGNALHNTERQLLVKETTLLAPMMGAKLPDGKYLGYIGYADNNSGIWKSLNPIVATVDADGMVTGVSTGTAEIRFYLNNGGGRYYSRMVKVKAPVPTKKPGTPILKGGVNKQTFAWLDWRDVADARGYQVYRYDNSKKKYVKVKEYPRTGVYIFNEDCSYGKTEKFKIRAFNDGDTGRAYGSFSNIVTIKTASPTTKVSKTAAGKGIVSLTWKKAAGAEYYQIYRATSKNGTYSKVKTVKGSVLTYKNTGLKRGKAYYYKVRSYRVNADGKKVYSKFSPVVGKKTK